MSGRRGALPTTASSKAARLPPFWTSVRFYAGAVGAFLSNLAPLGVRAKGVCVPALNCHGCPWATAACPVGVAAYGSAMHALPAMAVGSMLAVGVLFGRLICGFACPAGWFQDLLHRIPSPKLRLPRWIRWGRYLALALLVVTMPWWLGFGTGGFLSLAKPTVDKQDSAVRVGLTATNHGTETVTAPQVDLVWRSLADGSELERLPQRFDQVAIAPGERSELPTVTIPNRLAEANLQAESPQARVQLAIPLTYYCSLCPIGTFEAAVPALVATGTPPGHWSGQLWLRLGVAAVFLALMVAAARPFCRAFCPLGALWSLTHRLALARVEFTGHDICTDCGACERACPLDLELPREAGGPDCIACGDCVSACKQGGIQRRWGW
jgi:ferredoxin